MRLVIGHCLKGRETLKILRTFILWKIVKTTTWIEVSCPVTVQKCYFALLLVPFCSEWLVLSPQKFTFQNRFLTLLKLDYLYFLITINYPRFIGCVIANQLTGFYMPLFFTVKGTSKQTLIIQAFSFVGKAKQVLLISIF